MAAESPPKVELSPLAIRVVLLALMVDEEFWMRWWSVLGPEFFLDPYYGEVAKFLGTYWTKYGQRPSADIVIDHFTSGLHYDPSESATYDKVFDDLLAAPIDHLPFYEANLRLFVRQQAFQTALRESERHVEKLDFEAAIRVLHEANTIALHRDHGTPNYFGVEAAEARYIRRTAAEEKLPVLHTQIGNLDTYLSGGGLEARRFAVLIAPSGGGKSTALCHLGRVGVLQGKNILHVTLEMTRDEVSDMYDAAFTGTPRLEVKSQAARVRTETLAKLSKYGDRLRIVEYPEYSLKPEALEGMVELMVREGTFKPDVILVDYADLMLVGKGGFSSARDKQQALSYVYTYLHRLSKSQDCLVATGTQANREGMKAVRRGDGAVLEMTSAAEDISKVWAADTVLTFNQTRKEYQESIMRIFIAKQRGGPANAEITVRQDLARAVFALPTGFSSRMVTDDDD